MASESSKKALKIERRESYNHICIDISGIIPKLSTFVKTWSSLRTFIIDANEGRVDVIANLGFDQINETNIVLERQYDVMKILANNSVSLYFSPEFTDEHCFDRHKAILQSKYRIIR